MKLKIYLRMLLAAVAALFVTTGCSDSNDETGDGPTPPPDKPLTFQIGVSDINKDQAKLAVTPSDQTATYYYNAVKKSIYDALGSDQAFLDDDLEYLRSEADKQSMTLEAYLQSKTSRGTATYTLTGLEKETEYYAYVYGLKTDGTITSALTKSVFTSGMGADDPGPGPGGEGPKFKEFNLQPGDQNGEDSDSKITMTISATTTVTYGKYFVNTKEYVDGKLGEGMSYEDMVQQAGADLEPQAIEFINEGGLLFTLSGFDPQTEYTFVCLIGNDDGETVANGNVSTTAPGTETDGPKLALSIRLGDHDGNNTDTHVVIMMKAAGTTSGKFGVFDKTAVDAVLATGATYESIIKGEGNGQVMTAAHITSVAGGGLAMAISGLSPGTAYTAIVLVSNDNGDTVKAVNATTTGDGDVDPEDGPELEMSLQAGDADGLNKDSEMYMSAFAPDAVSSMYGLFATTDVENAIAGGATLDAIVTQNGEPMNAQWLSFLIEEPGIGVTFSGLDIQTSYTAIVKVTDADGKSTTKSAVGSTEGELVPSTVELKNLTQGEMGYYGDAYGLPENDYANWTIYLADATVDLDDLSGMGEVMMIELNTAKAVTTEITPGTYNVMPDRFGSSFVAFTCVPGYLGVTGSPFGTWYIKDESALNKALEGTVVVTKSDADYTFTFELVDISTATTIKGTYTGPLTYIDYTKSKAPARAPWKNAGDAFRKSIDTRINLVSAHSVTTVSKIDKMEFVTVEAPTSFEVQTSGIEFTPTVVKIAGYTSKVRCVRNE